MKTLIITALLTLSSSVYAQMSCSSFLSESSSNTGELLDAIRNLEASPTTSLRAEDLNLALSNYLTANLRTDALVFALVDALEPLRLEILSEFNLQSADDIEGLQTDLYIATLSYLRDANRPVLQRVTSHSLGSNLRNIEDHLQSSVGLDTSITTDAYYDTLTDDYVDSDLDPNSNLTYETYLGMLDDRTRDIVNRIVAEDMSFVEVAAVHNLSANRIRQLYLRGLRRINKRFFAPLLRNQIRSQSTRAKAPQVRVEEPTQTQTFLQETETRLSRINNATPQEFFNRKVQRAEQIFHEQFETSQSLAHDEDSIMRMIRIFTLGDSTQPETVRADIIEAAFDEIRASVNIDSHLNALQELSDLRVRTSELLLEIESQIGRTLSPESRSLFLRNLRRALTPDFNANNLP